MVVSWYSARVVPRIRLHTLRLSRYASTSTETHYQVFDLPSNASLRDIKKRFKVLSKKYHPDLNNHLDEEEKKLNKDKFLRIVSSYEVLKDKNKKAQYDAEIQNTTNVVNARRSQEWNNKYYGEAKYYSRSSHENNHYSRSGYLRTRHRVHNFNNTKNNSTFSGEHVNYGDRDDVPHFNYKEHLNKHLKFEQRILHKNLTEDEIQEIVKQLNKDGDASKVDPEVLTKHFMRQARLKLMKTQKHTTYSSVAQDPHIYQGSTETGFIRTIGAVGAIGILTLLWKTIG